MKTATRRCTALAGSIVLVAGPTILGAGGASDLRIEGFTVLGEMVRIGVVNTGAESSTGTVFVRMLTESGEVRAMEPVAAGGGQKVFVQVAAGSRILEILESGVVVDDGSPF